jgi:hypothetical protein
MHLIARTCQPTDRVKKFWGAMIALSLATSVQIAFATSCPFDTPGTALTREGLVLSRYANGFTGNALVANSGFAATDAPAIQSNIVALTDQLDLNRNGSFDTTDATIISRKIAGFNNAAATAGIPAANLGPGGASAVSSFLLSGCGNNAFVQGGNAFGAPAVLGTTDGQPLTLQSGATEVSMKVLSAGGYRLRVTPNGSANIVAGASTNQGESSILGIAEGAVVAGGGSDTTNCYSWDTGNLDWPCANRNLTRYSTISGGRANFIQAGEFGSDLVISGGSNNRIGVDATVTYSAIGGGYRNFVTSSNAVISGGSRNAIGFMGDGAVISGGLRNAASANAAVVSGGADNSATAQAATVMGGLFNSAGGVGATVAGGQSNNAWGDFSFAAGVRAKAYATSFVWGGSVDHDTFAAGVGTFTAYAPGGFYFYRGAPGAGGCTLPAGTVSWSCTSDRNTKTNITSLNARDILKRVANIPITRWSYKGTESVANIGPMAQDFWRAFQLGDSDKSIASMNMSGVALAAIQGLNQKLSEQVKAKDREIAALKARLDAIEKKLLSTR